MSRADREKSLYIIRLNQIKEELKKNFPFEVQESEAHILSLDIFQNEQKSLASEAAKNSYQQKMHGFTALESINEKIAEEMMSQEEDDGDDCEEEEHDLKQSNPFQI